MKIKTENFHKYIGEVISITNLEDDEIPNGSYQIAETHEHGIGIYSLKTGEVMFMEYDENEYPQIYTPVEEKLKLLYEYHNKQVMILLNEGWTLPKNDEKVMLDITPYMETTIAIKGLISELGIDYEH